MSPTQWAQLVAKDLGINVQSDPNAAVDILSWMVHEEPTSTWWGGYGSPTNPTRLNPLNAGDFGQFGYTGQQSGLGGYPSLTNAAAASAQMIRQSNMSPILSALQQGLDPGSFSRALESTPWASSHYGGATFTAGQAEQEAQGPVVRNAAAVGSGAGAASSAVSQALASQTNPAVVANTAAANALAEQLQLTPQEQAFQQQILAQNYGYAQQQFGVQGQQLALQMAEQQQQQQQAAQQRHWQVLQDQYQQTGIREQMGNIRENLANTRAGQALTRQGINLSERQGLQGLASSGVYNTGSRGQFEQQIQLQRSQENVAERQSEAAARQALAAENLAFHQLGVTEAQQASQYGYTQQQISNGMKNLALQQKQLGISEKEAKTQYQNALFQLNLNSLMNVDQLQQQIFALAGGGYSPLQGVIGQLQNLIPGLSGALKMGGQ